MEGLRAMAQRLPEWQKQLDGMDSSISKRQDDLAKLETTTPSDTISKTHDTPKIPKIDSTNDLVDASAPHASTDGFIHISDTPTTPSTQPLPITITADSARDTEQSTLATTTQPPTSALKRKACDGDNWSLRSSKMPKDENENKRPVYYDNLTQVFFGDLLRYISGCRNDMRRAKMDAKVAEIKRMAEHDMSAADGFDARSSVRLMSSRRFQSPLQSSSITSQHSDILQIVDEQLERVQDACENAAHNVLRFGSCQDDVSTVQSGVKHIIDSINRHIQAEQSKQAEVSKLEAQQDKEPMGARTRRFISMRRNIAGKDVPAIEPDGHALNAADIEKPLDPLVPTTNGITGLGQIEVDLDCLSDDAEADLPPVIYRSTRAMRR